MPKNIYDMTIEELERYGKDSSMRNVRGNINALYNKNYKRIKDIAIKAAIAFDVDPAVMFGKYAKETSGGTNVKRTGKEEADGIGQVSWLKVKDFLTNPNFQKYRDIWKTNKWEMPSRSNYMNDNINIPLSAMTLAFTRDRFPNDSQDDWLSAYNMGEHKYATIKSNPDNLNKNRQHYVTPVLYGAAMIREMDPDLQQYYKQKAKVIPKILPSIRIQPHNISPIMQRMGLSDFKPIENIKEEPYVPFDYLYR